MYSYDRRSKTAAGAFFNNFQAVPKRATIGSSLSPIQARVSHVNDDFFSLTAEVRGTLQGGLQGVSDELRITGMDMQEFVVQFFREPASMRGSQVVSQSDLAVVLGQSGVHLQVNAEFRCKGKTPEDLKRAVASAARFFPMVNIAFE